MNKVVFRGFKKICLTLKLNEHKSKFYYTLLIRLQFKIIIKIKCCISVVNNNIKNINENLYK